MTVESGNTISNFKSGQPLKSDPKHQGDDHIRLIKQILQSQFPDGVGGNGFRIPLTATTQQLNWLDKVKADVQGQFNHIIGIISTSAGNISTNAGNISTNAGNISTNTGNISTNTKAIGDATSGLTKKVNDNTAELAALDLDALDAQVATNKAGVSTNKGDITKLKAKIHIHMAGLFRGSDLSKLAGGNLFNVARAIDPSTNQPFPVGVYTITMNTPAIGHYVITGSAPAIVLVDHVGTTTFNIATWDVIGNTFVDAAEIHFMVADV